jgi:hypothetical protein
MGDLSPAERALLERALAIEPELAIELRPLLAGAYGSSARRLVLRRLVERLAAGATVRGALVPALADALRAASDHRPAGR